MGTERPAFAVVAFGDFDEPIYRATCATYGATLTWWCCEEGHVTVAQAAYHGGAQLAAAAEAEWAAVPVAAASSA